MKFINYFLTFIFNTLIEGDWVYLLDIQLILQGRPLLCLSVMFLHTHSLLKGGLFFQKASKINLTVIPSMSVYPLLLLSNLKLA